MSAQRAGEFFARADRDPVLKERVLAALSVEELLGVARSQGFVFEFSDMALLARGHDSAWLAVSACSTGRALLRYCHEAIHERSLCPGTAEVPDSCGVGAAETVDNVPSQGGTSS